MINVVLVLWLALLCPEQAAEASSQLNLKAATTAAEATGQLNCKAATPAAETVRQLNWKASEDREGKKLQSHAAETLRQLNIEKGKARTAATDRWIEPYFQFLASPGTERMMKFMEKIREEVQKRRTLLLQQQTQGKCQNEVEEHKRSRG
eukprot:TRINITY_DN15982_c1_g1_i1.p1 TRINITY_DN15982_c1_g1~~TRINITY_DN15982_c1_g1_i1.p1  ORF type:complete len:150 (+),score=53.15 TRINITY_DN15982_c1_g1_i1:46-495(+)